MNCTGLYPRLLLLLLLLFAMTPQNCVSCVTVPAGFCALSRKASPQSWRSPSGSVPDILASASSSMLVFLRPSRSWSLMYGYTLFSTPIASLCGLLLCKSSLSIHGLLPFKTPFLSSSVHARQSQPPLPLPLFDFICQKPSDRHALLKRFIPVVDTVASCAQAQGKPQRPQLPVINVGSHASLQAVSLSHNRSSDSWLFADSTCYTRIRSRKSQTHLLRHPHFSSFGEKHCQSTLILRSAFTSKAQASFDSSRG